MAAQIGFGVFARDDAAALTSLIETSSIHPNDVIFDAIDFDAVSCLKLLLSLGADPNIKHPNCQKTTALLYSAENSHYGCCRVLLQHGADVNATDDDDRTLLIIYMYRDVETDDIQQLIDNGADLDVQDNLGISAALYAVLYGRPEFLELLLAAGARTDLKSNKGYTVLDAAQGGYERVKTYMNSISVTGWEQRCGYVACYEMLTAGSGTKSARRSRE